MRTGSRGERARTGRGERMTFGKAALVAAILLISACGNTDPQPLPSLPSEAADLPPTASEPLGITDRADLFTRALREKPSTRATLRMEYGPPDSMSSRTTPNRHVPGAVDTLEALHYAGLSVRFHVPGSGGEIVSRVEVFDNRYLEYPLIGASFAELERQIGAPEQRSDSLAIYRCRACVAGDDPVELIIGEDLIRRVRFNYYVD